MKFQLITEQPLWWILLCLLLGLGYAFLLYRNRKNPDNLNPALRWLLFAFRTFVIAFLAFLLLSPMIKTLFREKEKPLLILAQDNTESIVLNKDSAFYRNTYPGEMESFLNGLKDKFDVKTISWGEKVGDVNNYSFNEKETDFSSLMDALNVRFSNRNVGAIVIASDGLYNKGSNPVYQSSALKVPLYTVALGDTVVQKDILIASVNFNKIVYLGNSFPIEISVEGRQCEGAQSTLTVKQDSAVVFSKVIPMGSNRFRQVATVILDAKKTGMQHYKIELSPVEGEVTKANNIRDIFVEVLESKQKILIVANAPHPDLGALKLSIESNQNYSVKVVMVDHTPDQLNEYNLVILHNLPSLQNNLADLLKRAEKANIPLLYIVGLQTDINLFNELKTGVNISNSLEKANPVQATLNSNFSAFTISEELKRVVPQFPPLLSPFGKYKSVSANYVLLYQQIGNISTEDPLLAFNETGPSRTGIFCAEGLWQWRLNDFMLNNNFNGFNELILKIIQNLSVKENRTHFRLTTKNNFAENEPISFDAEVYNDNYELINAPDVSLTIVNSDKKSFPYIFSKTDRAYTLNAGFMPPGDYRYKATVKTGDKMFTNDGQFTVSALQVEQTETVADHQMLYALAHKNGGELYYPSQLDLLKKALLNREDIKTVVYSHTRLQDLINLKLIFFLLLALLTLEWFLRKRAGAY